MSSYFIHTGLKSLPPFVSIASSTMLCDKLYAMCRSSDVSDRSRLELASDTHDPAICPIFNSQQD